jgi:adenylosuccinate lyase
MNAEEGRKSSREHFGHDTYLSPFTWRYGSSEMRSIFSEGEKRATWRKVWLSLAEAEHRRGIVSKAELDDIRARSGRQNIDIGAAQSLERRIRHDLMAELKVFSAQAKTGGGKLHLGATSSDIEDNTDMLLYRRALSVILSRLTECLHAAREKILRYKGMACIAWTHLQPAEPTTLGYRFANYAQDLVLDVQYVEMVREIFLKGKGVKGAVGTSASFKALVESDAEVRGLEKEVMDTLGLDSFSVTTQTYPRKVDYVLLSCLAAIAQSCHRFGADLRVLQSPGFGELSEPSSERQVGSSAMPFKRNPVKAERMCSLARLVSVMPGVAFANAANSMLERTLDDSASRRIVIPEAFLAVDECLSIYAALLTGLRVYPDAIRKNLERFGPFAGTEAVMMKVVARGENRQRLHESIRVKSMAAREKVMHGEPNPLLKMLAADARISSKLKHGELTDLMNPTKHVGDASQKSLDFVEEVIDPMLAAHRVPKRKSRVEF